MKTKTLAYLTKTILLFIIKVDSHEDHQGYHRIDYPGFHQGTLFYVTKGIPYTYPSSKTKR